MNAALPFVELDWIFRDIKLVLLPVKVEEKVRRTGDEVLTWRLWMMAISGLRGFVDAYEGVDFEFEVFVGGEGGVEDVRVGIGRLGENDEDVVMKRWGRV